MFSQHLPPSKRTRGDIPGCRTPVPWGPSARSRGSPLGLVNMQSAIWTPFISLQEFPLHGRKGSEESQAARTREEAERSQTWCQVLAAHCAPGGGGRSGVDGRSRKSHSRHKRGSWGMPPQPSAWPCKTQKWRLWPLRATEHCTNTGESLGRLPRRRQGLSSCP